MEKHKTKATRKKTDIFEADVWPCENIPDGPVH